MKIFSLLTCWDQSLFRAAVGQGGLFVGGSDGRGLDAHGLLNETNFRGFRGFPHLSFSAVPNFLSRFHTFSFSLDVLLSSPLQFFLNLFYFQMTICGISPLYSVLESKFVRMSSILIRECCVDRYLSVCC